MKTISEGEHARRRAIVAKLEKGQGDAAHWATLRRRGAVNGAQAEQDAQVAATDWPQVGAYPRRDHRSIGLLRGALRRGDLSEEAEIIMRESLARHTGGMTTRKERATTDR